MDSSFNDGAAGGPPQDPPSPTPSSPSPATERFLSCRWRKAAEEGVPDHCTHRDVLPMAGTAGFLPDAWCTDCAFYKARRTPKKRQDDSQPDAWRPW